MKFKRLLRILRNYMNNELDSEILNIIKSSIRDLKSRTETLSRINRKIQITNSKSFTLLNNASH